MDLRRFGELVPVRVYNQPREYLIARVGRNIATSVFKIEIVEKFVVYYRVVVAVHTRDNLYIRNIALAIWIYVGSGRW